MPKLSAQERNEFERRLSEPLTSTSFGAIVDAISQYLGFWTLVQNSPFRDAFTAHRFAAARGAATVRLGDDPPDFHLTGMNGCSVFEVVETYPEGRRRSDEYRKLALADDKRREFGKESLTAEERDLFAPVQDPEEDWKPRARTATQLLARAARQKATKGYPSDWGLVIKLDLGGFVHSEAAVVAQMASATAPARFAFEEVWVLWGDAAHLTWRAGKPC